MNELSFIREITEIKDLAPENFKEIKPEEITSPEEARGYIDDLFENIESEKILDNYFSDLKERSDCPETIKDKPFELSDLRKISPEENAELRSDFSEKKAELKNEWEKENGMPWPKYDQDIYSANGKLIRKAGQDYDAHHIQPLGMGGKNEAGNITPLHAEVHYDKQGIHAPGSPYDDLNQILGGMRQ